MAMAVFLNSADLAAFLAALQAAVPSLSGADRTAINRLITALTNWQNLPTAPSDRRQGDADTRVVVLSQSGQTKQAIIDLLNRVHARGIAGTTFLQAVAKDLRTSAVDPWA
jgi:hypothetical protein